MLIQSVNDIVKVVRMYAGCGIVFVKRVSFVSRHTCHGGETLGNIFGEHLFFCHIKTDDRNAARKILDKGLVKLFQLLGFARTGYFICNVVNKKRVSRQTVPFKFFSADLVAFAVCEGKLLWFMAVFDNGQRAEGTGSLFVVQGGVAFLPPDIIFTA